MNNNLQILKNKIKTLVPDIMKLEFGCEIEINNLVSGFLSCSVGGTFDKWIIVQDNLDTLSVIREDSGNNVSQLDTVRNKEGDDYKIIGRPITLFDIRKIFKENNDFGSCNLVLKLWDLWGDKDDLDSQSEKLINFLFDIFK